MPIVLKILGRLFDFFYRLLILYSQIVLLVIIALVSTQVVLRKVFRSGIVWVEEVSLLLLVWMAFITMAIGVAEDLHISISLIFDMLPKAARTAIAALNHVLTAGMGALLAWYGFQLILSTMNSTLPTTKWPTFILYLMIPVSGLYIAYFSLRRLWRRSLGAAANGEEGKIFP
jgi:TRAP-type C4-dicarboxylate transport system permease small subunit